MGRTPYPIVMFFLRFRQKMVSNTPMPIKTTGISQNKKAAPVAQLRKCAG